MDPKVPAELQEFQSTSSQSKALFNMLLASGPNCLTPCDTRGPEVDPPDLAPTDPGGQNAEDPVVQDVEARPDAEVDGGRDQGPQVPERGG